MFRPRTTEDHTEILDFTMKKTDSEMPLKKIKLEPVEAPTILIPSTNHPIPVSSNKVIVVSDNSESGSGSQFSFMAAEKKDIDTQWVKTGRKTLLIKK